MSLNDKKEVRIIGYVTNEVKDIYAPVPEDFMCNEENLPQSLIDDFKRNGWQDSDGVIWWHTDFRPDPVMGTDGNVYLCVSDTDTANMQKFWDRMNRATAMLNA